MVGSFDNVMCNVCRIDLLCRKIQTTTLWTFAKKAEDIVEASKLRIELEADKVECALFILNSHH